MTAHRTLAEAPGARPVPCLELAEWWQAFGVVAGITTRERGFDLGLFGPGQAKKVNDNWQTFEDAFRSQFPAVRVGHQVHGCAIQNWDQSAPGRQIAEGIDGHVTSTTGLLLSVSVADCVPIYLLHHPSGTMALLHAGWRGTAAGMLEAGIAALAVKARGRLSDVVMHCGVAICGSCYEVGPEVVKALLGRESDRKETVDLRAILMDRARQIGLQDVTSTQWCSAHDADRFYSHRASAGRDGRMLAFLGRPTI